MRLCPIHGYGLCALFVGLQSTTGAAYEKILPDAGGVRQTTRSMVTGTTTTMLTMPSSPAHIHGPSASDPIAIWLLCSRTSSVLSKCAPSIVTVTERAIRCLLRVQVCKRVRLPELPQLPLLQRADLRRGLGLGQRHVAAQVRTLSVANEPFVVKGRSLYCYSGTAP